MTAPGKATGRSCARASSGLGQPADSKDDFDQLTQCANPVGDAWLIEKGKAEPKNRLNPVYYQGMRMILHDLMGLPLVYLDGEISTDKEARGKMLIKRREGRRRARDRDAQGVSAHGRRRADREALPDALHAADGPRDQPCLPVAQLGCWRRAGWPSRSRTSWRSANTPRASTFAASTSETTTITSWSPPTGARSSWSTSATKVGRPRLPRGLRSAPIRRPALWRRRRLPGGQDAPRADRGGVPRVQVRSESEQPGAGSHLHRPGDGARDFYKLTRGTPVGKGANFNYWYSGSLSTVGMNLGWSPDEMWEAVDRYRSRFPLAEAWRVGRSRRPSSMASSSCPTTTAACGSRQPPAGTPA
jgi:hypothetical protein